MSTRRPIGLALTGNCLVAVATYAWLGWNAPAAHAAARNTARFSLLWFAVGFATPGLERFFKRLPQEYRTIQAFAVAHCVHFATVAALVFTFEKSHLRHHAIQAALVIGIGFSITMLAGLTAAPRESRIYHAIHGTMLYLLFIIFFFAFVHHPYKPLRTLSALLGIALVLRLTKYFAARPDRDQSAAAAG